MEFFELMYYAELFTPANATPWTVLWISLIIAGCVYVVIYAMEAVALWTISGREGYSHRWMSFVPFFNTYYIGVVSEKNKFYNFPTKVVSLTLAIVEFLLVAGNILYYSVAGIVYQGNLYVEVTAQYLGEYVLVGYAANSTIANTWIGWIFDYLSDYVITWVNLLYLLISVFVVISFFQTYACRRYVLLSLASVLFPIKGILMFAVRNNRGMNYRDYVRGEQRRRYEMYQQYNNQNGGNGYGGYNPYNGRPAPPPSDDPYGYGSSGSLSSAEDPFDGLGSSSSSGKSSSSSPDDPFDEFNNN